MILTCVPQYVPQAKALVLLALLWTSKCGTGEKTLRTTPNTADGGPSLDGGFVTQLTQTFAFTTEKNQNAARRKIVARHLCKFLCLRCAKDLSISIIAARIAALMAICKLSTLSLLVKTERMILET